MNEPENTTEGGSETQYMSDGEAGVDAIAAAQEALPPAPDNVTDISKPQERKPSKQEIKQAQRFEERLRRVVNKNPGMTRQQALQAIQREDYDALPPERKIKIMEGRIQWLEGLVRQIAENLGNDIRNLQHNDGELADALDINFPAFAQMLVGLGVSLETQSTHVRQCEADLAAKKKAEEERKNPTPPVPETKASTDKTEVQAVEKESKEIDTAGTPHVPEEATTFG